MDYMSSVWLIHTTLFIFLYFHAESRNGKGRRRGCTRSEWQAAHLAARVHSQYPTAQSLDSTEKHNFVICPCTTITSYDYTVSIGIDGWCSLSFGCFPMCNIFVLLLFPPFLVYLIYVLAAHCVNVCWN